ncbi:hypothetical protein FANTH_9295 [Fusarium anthophilum]|uniref:Alpha/beta hydrolase fold-3 domain-containing protein n=1 Tax=Fusarium anthophilum TaxID=48485 RepID=A0A8H4Z6L1_9HYPO|nr:hypothetical protein FANTH_9295 [Fusarium anthophilum]
MSESIIREPGLAKIDPEWEAFEKQFPVPPLLGTPQQLRLRLKFPKTNSPPVGYSIRDVEVPGYLGATNQLRLYTPNDSSEPLPVVIYVHGGGWTIGDLDSEDKVCRTMCNSAGVIVASVDYRKAPENPFPIGLEDAWQGVLWASLPCYNHDRLLMGNSRSRTESPKFVHTDAIPRELDFTSYAENATAPILPAAAVIQCLGYYGAPPEDIRISPLLAKDHSGLPPAYIQVAGADPLRDDGFAYAERLQKAGIPVRVKLRRVDEDHLIYNSTGTLSYKFKGQSKPWYITTAVTDVRPPNGQFVAGRSSELDSSQELSVFVSVPQGYDESPDGRDIRVCSHMMSRVKNTSDNPTDAEYSCKGVISDKCVKEYENATLLVPALGQPCPDFGSISLDLSKECRKQIFAGPTKARNFSSTDCSLDKMPYLDLPANYTTFGTHWSGYDGDSDREDFDKYDETVQETIPVLISVAKGNDSSESKLFCIAPDQVVPGSRKPESKLGDQEEDENRASRVGGLGAVLLGVGVVMIFGGQNMKDIYKATSALEVARLYINYQSGITSELYKTFTMFALAWLYLLGTCLAQGSSPSEDCSPSDFTDNVDKRAISFNASGTLPIEFKGAKNPWYISTAVTDERDQNRTFDGAHSRQWIKGFISVPRYLVADKSVEVCSFMFEGLNSSSENPDDADGSCKGVISDACIEELENSTLPIRTSGGCPSSAAFILSAQCKKHLTLYQQVSPRNISTDSCTLGNIPNLDVPVDYWTYGGSISSGETGDGDYDDFDSYDMRVQQTIPIFTVVSGGGISDRKLVCIAPNKIVSGSRKPELKLGEAEEDEDDEGEGEEGDENMASRVGGLGFVFLRICLAQNSSLPEDCPSEIRRVNDGRLIYNSTRTARTKFAGQGLPWYITAAVTDKRAIGARVFGGVDTAVFISVPKTLAGPTTLAGQDILVCSSMLKAVNRTSENPLDMDAPENTPYANHSCKGVMSEKCIGEFENSTRDGIGRAARCPNLYTLGLSDDCRDGLLTGRTGDEDRENFDRLICIAPDQVVPGSRKPQLKLEEEDEGEENDEEKEEEENSAPRAGGLEAATVFLGVSAIIFSLL